MDNPLVGRDLISIADLSKHEIESILSTAEKFLRDPPPPFLKKSILASCFFEPSTRTRLSFESAMLRLGGANIGFSDMATTSMKKNETLFDTMKVIGSYADVIVIRHPQEGSAGVAASAVKIPVINAGDGANQHPTQTLIDLFSIQQVQGKIDHLQIALAGDLKYGRTAHSLILALADYPVHLHLIAEERLSLPVSMIEELKKKGVAFSFHGSIEEILPEVDVLYMTRIQKERFAETDVPFQNGCILKLSHLKGAKKNLQILHPLPRDIEIEEGIDASPHAYYFQQAANGIPVRMALLSLLLNK
ncbi:MAG: aspartate carbamoyltransferase [Chlamydiota bacterium]